MIFFDDLGFGDLSSYGNRLIETPQIDRAAEEGLVMTGFYSASSVCTPSRAADRPLGQRKRWGEAL